MVFAVVDTPRTEIGDQTQLSDFNDPDFSTANSIESPTKQGENPLLKQIRGMRNSTNGGRSPRSRLPLADRRNPGGKGEFTPLLKSATKNNFMRSNGPTKENFNGELETPAGLKADYGREHSPALPFYSSVIVEEAEEYTGISAGQDDVQGSIVAPPVSSSSALSTPMAIAQRQSDGALDHQGNIATLREQEAKLVHIDKENFGLKLKIHFLELALQKNGKEFNEQAIRENAELKVDKITLQRDMKHYRKLLSQAEKDLETYRQQLNDYAEKVKRRHMDEDMKEELDRLRQSVTDGEAKIEELQEKVDTAQALEERVEKLQDDCSDLEAELRQKERELEEKDSDLQELRESGHSDESLKEQLEEKIKLLEEKDEDIEALQDALQNAEESAEQRVQEKQRLLEEKDDELQDLEDQLKDHSLVRSKDSEKQKLLEEKEDEIGKLKTELAASVKNNKLVLEEKDREIEKQNKDIVLLQDELSSVDELKQKVEELQEKLKATEVEHSAETRKKNHTIEEKESEIHTLEQKLESAEGRDSEAEKLQDQIADLEAEVREKSRFVEEREDEIANLNETIQQIRQQTDEEAIEYEDRIQELETQQVRHVTEVQELRDAKNVASEGRSQALETAQERIQDLENQVSIHKEQEGHLQIEINKLHDQIKRSQSDLDDKDATYAKQQQKWVDDHRSLESEKVNAEQRAAGLQRTVAELQDSEGTLSSRETQLQKALKSEEDRHRSEEDRLQKELRTTTNNLENERTRLNQAEESLRNSQTELSELKAQHSLCEEHETSLRDNIQSLEDEIEVLQCSADEDADQARINIDAAKQEAESLQKRIKELQSELSTARLAGDQAQVPLNAEAFQRSNNEHQLQQKLMDLQNHLSKANNDKVMLHDDLASTNADFEALKSTVSQLESSRDTAQEQSRDLRKQLQSLQREHERKSQSQVLSYEQDIQNLEQDLMDANAKQAELESKSHAAEQQISRLQTKIKSLDAELANARAQRASGDTSVAERKELHEMLKDAKLEAEDLTLQVKDRDGRLSAFASKEASLREQLKRLREERSMQTTRADALAKDLDDLQRKHETLSEAMQALQERQRHVRFPGASSAATPGADVAQPVAAASQDELARAQKRHAAELRGLGRQIEYLAARCRREGRFRADLGYVKQYFTRQVEMHGRCTRADLRLVRAMGIPVDEVVAQEQAAAALEGGRVETRDGRGTRPTLRCVGCVVVACVRMQRGAERWAAVKKGHEALVKKLRDVQGGRARERDGEKARVKRVAMRTEF